MESSLPLEDIKVLFPHFYLDGSAKNVRFWLFCVDLVTESEKIKHPEADLQGLYFSRASNYMINCRIW